MIFLLLICMAILLLYLTKIAIYRRNWFHCPVFESEGLLRTPLVSVVIAFRNEEVNLPSLLNSLEMQKYPAGFREVILVDDHSSDGSASLAAVFSNLHEGFRYIRNEPGKNGKKAALLKGIREAAHDLIVVTDADCIMGDYWLSDICGFFARYDPDMIIGLVDIKVGRGFFNRFQEAEFLSLVAAGAASAAGGRPIYCNAANLAFTKEWVLSRPDPMNIHSPSGDDTFLLHRIKKENNSRILLLKSRRAIVRTAGADSFREFLNQRIRWASKSLHYRDTDTIYTACLIWIVSFITVGTMVFAIAGFYPWLFPVVLAGKGLADYIFLQGFLRFYGKKLHFPEFFIFEIIYPFYIMMAALCGLFNLYSWKNRRYGRKNKSGD
jgi:cellulose synthase/poly-beta-1,6-N-acetylglucosamine synthase-like glycosyltransferase